MSDEQQQELNSELTWADTVMLVFKYFGEIMKTPDIEGSTTAKKLHDWVTAGNDNETKFLTTMVPKATEIIAKYRKKDNDDSIIESERRTIIDLKLRLAEAVENSADITA